MSVCWRSHTGAAPNIQPAETAECMAYLFFISGIGMWSCFIREIWKSHPSKFTRMNLLGFEDFEESVYQ